MPTSHSVPEEYAGREQSYLKHRVLHEYLQSWGRKVGSLARTGPVKLWYVDCFAGPWQARGEDLRDTSIYIGLKALEDARKTWRDAGRDIALGAVFVEKERHAFERLHEFLRNRDGDIETIARHGEFGGEVDDIARRLGQDPAFVFIDPTGFKGVDMSFIAILMQERMRDVMVNVMFNDINRFKEDERAFLRRQMKDFFGLREAGMPKGLSEIELLALYRDNLKRICRVRHAADLAIPHPTHQRTWFRLVIGGNHPEVLKVFRGVESKVIGREAAGVRVRAKQRDHEDRTGQLSLLGQHEAPPLELRYEQQNTGDLQAAKEKLLEELRGGTRRFGDLWPRLLESHHLTHADLIREIRSLRAEGRVIIEPSITGRQSITDSHRLSLPGL
jgi:three-Cys-motif partner protein